MSQSIHHINSGSISKHLSDADFWRSTVRLPAQPTCCRCGCETPADMDFEFVFHRHARDVNSWTVRAPLCLECREFITQWQLLVFVVAPLISSAPFALIACAPSVLAALEVLPHSVGFSVAFAVFISGPIAAWLFIQHLKRWGVWPVTSSGPFQLKVNRDADPRRYWRGKTEDHGLAEITTAG